MSKANTHKNGGGVFSSNDICNLIETIENLNKELLHLNMVDETKKVVPYTLISIDSHTKGAIMNNISSLINDMTSDLDKIDNLVYVLRSDDYSKTIAGIRYTQGIRVENNELFDAISEIITHAKYAYNLNFREINRDTHADKLKDILLSIKSELIKKSEVIQKLKQKLDSYSKRDSSSLSEIINRQMYEQYMEKRAAVSKYSRIPGAAGGASSTKRSKKSQRKSNRKSQRK